MVFLFVQSLLVARMNIPLQIDLHVHSEGSYDGSEPVDLILEHAADIGLDAVVITDHDTIHESLRAAELAPEYGLIGIPGVEVSTAHGHLLAIGVEEMPPRRAPYDETVDWIPTMVASRSFPIPSSGRATEFAKRTFPMSTRLRRSTRGCLPDTRIDAPDGLRTPTAIRLSRPVMLTRFRMSAVPTPRLHWKPRAERRLPLLMCVRRSVMGRPPFRDGGHRSRWRPNTTVSVRVGKAAITPRWGRSRPPPMPSLAH